MLNEHPWGDNPHIDRVLEPFAGLRPDKLDCQSIMTLQCFIDDSGSEPQSEYFVLAGFISKVRDWASFSAKWHELLSVEPKLEYYKAGEAMGLRKQFKRDNGWSRDLVDKRVIKLSSVIKKHCKLGICTRMRHEDFNKYIATIPVPRERSLADNNPYHMLQLNLLSSYWHHCEREGIKERCNFIFDNQIGFEHDSRKLFNQMSAAFREDYPKSHLSYIGSPPSFGDEKEYLPLQAADLVAWCLRRSSVTGRSGNMPQEAMDILNSIPYIRFEIDEARLKKYHDEIAPQVLAAQQDEEFKDLDWRLK